MSSQCMPSEVTSIPAQGEWSKNFFASYSAKDIIQYALALGFGSTKDKEDLKYTFEENPDFQAVPTFFLILTNWATLQRDGSFNSLPQFPTELMKYMGVIPPGNLQGDDTNLKPFPVLHISQSIHWHRSVPIPKNQSKVSTLISSRVVYVKPKSIGTFIETETQIHDNNGELLCSLSATTLVLGIPPSRVVPYANKCWSNPPSIKYPSHPPDSVWLFSIAPNQALLYRVSSGDTNRIHVVPDPLRKPIIAGMAYNPILHGSCTLGIAMRGLIQYVAKDYSIFSLRADFSNPVYIDDSLRLEVWNVSPLNKLFRVVKNDSDTIVVDNAVLNLIPLKQSNRSKL
jgi:acyl dehydratase